MSGAADGGEAGKATSFLVCFVWRMMEGSDEAIIKGDFGFVEGGKIVDNSNLLCVERSEAKKRRM